MELPEEIKKMIADASLREAGRGSFENPGTMLPDPQKQLGYNMAAAKYISLMGEFAEWVAEMGYHQQTGVRHRDGCTWGKWNEKITTMELLTEFFKYKGMIV